MKTILVTGGNRGIGKETCRQLAAAGHQVFLGSRDLANGNAAAAELKGNVQAIALDTSNPEQMKEAIGLLSKRISRLDVLINNAGIISSPSPSSEVDIAEVRAVMETNFFGVWRLVQLVLPLLERSDAGRIINLSSEMGEIASLKMGRYAAYRISKASLNSLSILLAADLQQFGTTVAAMCPGWVQTDMGGSSAPRTVEQGADTAVWLATVSDLPTGRFWRDRKEIQW